MHSLRTSDTSANRAERLEDDAPILDPYFDPRSFERCVNLLMSLQRRGPAQRREAIGRDDIHDRYSLVEIAQIRKPAERPPLANVARAVEACDLPVVLVWRDGEPCLGVDFQRKSES